MPKPGRHAYMRPQSNVFGMQHVGPCSILPARNLVNSELRTAVPALWPLAGVF